MKRALDSRSGLLKGTRRTQRDRLYRTGDFCVRLPCGRIECLGRLDAQVKIRGFRIELGDVEAALSALPSVEAAAVAPRTPKKVEKRNLSATSSRGRPGAATTAPKI